MSTTMTETPSTELQQTRTRQAGATTASAEWPRLLEGTTLEGRFEGSGLREAPYLVRRRDGQIVQLSRVLYAITERMDGRTVAAVASDVSEHLNLRVTPELIVHVAEHKLAPLGLVAHRDGTEPRLEHVDALLSLKFRAGVVPAGPVNWLAGVLRPFFLPPVVIAALTGLVACDVWMATSHGLGTAMRELIHSPSLGLALFALLIASMAFHECGHAAACRYGGARPGRIGVGIYLVWPAFFTDVTDSYRLSRAGRLRTDLGGVYFNALIALSAAGAYFATGYEPLLIVVVGQQALLVDQFVPWMRLDGYHIVSDLIGVSDLFARIKPVLRSLVPGGRPDRRVTELKPWARAAVTFWVLTTVAVLSTMLVVVVVSAPNYLQQAWQSMLVQVDAVTTGLRIGSAVLMAGGVIGAGMLLLPVAALTLTYLLLCRSLGTAVAVRHARVNLTLPAPSSQTAKPSGLATPSV
jgi:putative peptide zinc metalloprotease protein